MSQDVFLFGWHTTTAMKSAPLPVSSQPQWKATFIVARMQCCLHYKGVDHDGKKMLKSPAFSAFFHLESVDDLPIVNAAAL